MTLNSAMVSNPPCSSAAFTIRASRRLSRILASARVLPRGVFPAVRDRRSDRVTKGNLTVKTVTYPTQDTLYKALYDGTCGAVTQVMTPLASTIVASGKQANYIVLPDLVALQPLAAFVRNNDEAWLDVVRWTFNAQLHGEDLKITRASAASERSSSSPEVRRLPLRATSRTW